MPETLRLHRLLVVLVANGMELDHPSRFASLLGPVLCRSASEQEIFCRHVEEWWPGPVVAGVSEAREWTDEARRNASVQPSASFDKQLLQNLALEPGASENPENPAAAPTPSLEGVYSGVESGRQRILGWLPAIPVALVVSTGVVIAGSAGVVEMIRQFRVLQPHTTAQSNKSAGNFPKPGIQAAPQSQSQKPALGSPPKDREPRRESPIETTATTGTRSRSSRKVNTPPTKPFSPQGGPSRKSSVSPPPTEAPDKSAIDSRLKQDHPKGVFLLPSEIVLLLLFGSSLSLVAIQAIVRAWWWRQARLVLQRLPIQGDPQLHRIALETIVPDLFLPSDVYRIGRALNHWQRVQSDLLDGNATVEASLSMGGWFSPRYCHRRERVSYLFLLDQESLADQQTRHLRAWLERLRDEGVLAEWVCFRRDPFFCQGPTGHGPLRSLSELATQHPESVVVVVADGERFFSPVDGSVEPWLGNLQTWPRRVALTPRPAERWGSLEAELKRNVKVVPASLEGLLALGHWLEEFSPLLREAPSGSSAPEPPSLRSSSLSWLERTPPSMSVVDNLLRELRAFLGHDGFIWLAACAVFPEMHWTITAYLGQSLCSINNEPLLRVYSLLHLARLPWLRHGYMPDWLRLKLILSLNQKQEEDIRQALADLLLASLEGGEVSSIQLDVATSYGKRLSRLLPPLLELLHHRSRPTSPLRDQLFLHFLQNRPLLAADAPPNLRELMHAHKGKRWAQWRHCALGRQSLFAATFLVLVLGGLSLAALRQLQLTWIEKLLQTTSSDAMMSSSEATERLQRAITSFGLSRSSLMLLVPYSTLQRIEEALAAGASAESLELFRLKHDNVEVKLLTFSPDGSVLGSLGADHTVRAWDVRNGEAIIPPLKPADAPISSLAISPGGSLIAISGETGAFSVFETKTGKSVLPPIRGDKHGASVLAFSPDGTRILSGGVDGKLRQWDINTGDPITTSMRGHWKPIRSLMYNLDGSLIASSGDDKLIRLWKATGLVPIASFSQRRNRSSASVVMRLDPKAKDAGLGDETTRRTEPYSLPESVGFSTDNRLITLSGDNQIIRLWDIKNGTPVITGIKEDQTLVTSLAVGSKDQLVAIGERDGTIRLWGFHSSRRNFDESGQSGRTPPMNWRQTLPIACARLKNSRPINYIQWLNISRATCQHFVWSQRPRLHKSHGQISPIISWTISLFMLFFFLYLLIALLHFVWRLVTAIISLFLPARDTRARLIKFISKSSTPIPTITTWKTHSVLPLSFSADLKLEISTVDVTGFHEDLGHGLFLPMVLIQAGSFEMGSSIEEVGRTVNEGPQHKVDVGRFWMSQMLITQEQWREVASWRSHTHERWSRKLRLYPSRFRYESGSDQRPVENVCWHDAIEFCYRLSQRTGRVYTLPTEAQWEYACRAGSDMSFAFGNSLPQLIANYKGSRSNRDANSFGIEHPTTPVGLYPANAWGLHDMHGNAAEWCLDDWRSSYDVTLNDSSAWLNKDRNSPQPNRVVRGGSWIDEENKCRSAYRTKYNPFKSYSFIGFRVVCSSDFPLK